MSNLYRRSYRDDELDSIDGPVPAWGNPASVEAKPVYSPGSRCVECDVQWNRADHAECWSCGVDPRGVAS